MSNYLVNILSCGGDGVRKYVEWEKVPDAGQILFCSIAKITEK